MKSRKKATKSNKKQKRISELEKPKRATKSKKSPNRNQALLENCWILYAPQPAVNQWISNRLIKYGC